MVNSWIDRSVVFELSKRIINGHLIKMGDTSFGSASLVNVVPLNELVSVFLSHFFHQLEQRLRNLLGILSASCLICISLVELVGPNGLRRKNAFVPLLCSNENLEKMVSDLVVFLYILDEVANDSDLFLEHSHTSEDANVSVWFVIVISESSSFLVFSFLIENDLCAGRVICDHQNGSHWLLNFLDNSHNNLNILDRLSVNLELLIRTLRGILNHGDSSWNKLLLSFRLSVILISTLLLLGVIPKVILLEEASAVVR